MILGASYPELQVSRGMGQNIGKLLRYVPEERRPAVLSYIARKVEKNPLLLKTPKGDPTPVLRYLPDAAARAIGTKPIYTPAKSDIGRAIQNAWMKATLKGRGVLGGGLPSAGRAQELSKLRDMLPSVGLVGAGGTLAAGLGPLAALPAVAALPAGVLGAHVALGGIKGLGSHSKKIQEIGRQGAIRGFASGVLPGLRKRPVSAKRFEQLTDTLVSPALGDVERLAASVGNAASASAGRRVFAKPTVKLINRLKGVKQKLPDRNLRNFLASSAATGAGLAGLKRLSSAGSE